MNTSAPARDPRIGIEEYARLPDRGGPTELVRGRVVREPQPGFDHGRIQAALIEVLRAHLREHAPDMVCAGGFGVVVAQDPPTVRGPDVAVVRRARLAEPTGSEFLVGAPELVMEIISPSNTAAEIHTKVLEYLGAGASAVWVVYPETRTVAVHDSRRTASLFGTEDVLAGGEPLPRLRLPVTELFED